MVGRIGGASSSEDESVDGDRPCTRLLVPLFQREHILAYNLPLIARSGDSRPLAELATRTPGGLVDLHITASRRLWALLIVHAVLTRSFKTITRTSC